MGIESGWGKKKEEKPQIKDKMYMEEKAATIEKAKSMADDDMRESNVMADLRKSIENPEDPSIKEKGNS